MIISNLEHLEIICQENGSKTPKQVSGGFVFTVATGDSNASGSIAAITSVKTKAVTVNYAVFLPPLLSF